MIRFAGDAPRKMSRPQGSGCGTTRRHDDRSRVARPTEAFAVCEEYAGGEACRSGAPHPTSPGPSWRAASRDSALRVAGRNLCGWAVILYGHVRATDDMDIFVRASKANSERVVAALEAFGAPSQAHGVAASHFAQEGAAYRFGMAPLKVEVQAAGRHKDLADVEELERLEPTDPHSGWPNFWRLNPAQNLGSVSADK